MTVTQLISAEQLSARIHELAEQISNDYNDIDISMVCILKGGVMFMVDLARLINKNVEIDFMDVSSYGNLAHSSGNLEINLDLRGDLSEKHILIVEDIVDSGRTLSFLYDYIKSKNPASIKICSLLDKPHERVIPINIDYVGFEILNEFVVGYGLDYAQKYRNLNYIGVLHF